MSDDDTRNDWLWWAIPLVLVLAVAAWLILGDGGAPSNFEYDVD